MSIKIHDLILKSELQEVLETIISACDTNEDRRDSVTDGDIYLAVIRIAEKYRKRAYDQWAKEEKVKVHANELKRITSANSIK